MGLNYILKKIDHRSAPAIVLFLYLLLYLLFPSGLSSGDGWNYAAEIRHSGHLFHPFHLLYNLLGSLFCFLPSRMGADILGCLKVMNSIFAVLVIYAVQLISGRMGTSRLSIIAVSSITGASFSVMRYATENETYILPLFLGLMAIYYWIWFFQSGNMKHVMLSGLFASLSVLFHASYIFWWAGLLTGFIRSVNRRHVIIFLTVSLIVPAIYITAVFFEMGSLSFNSVSRFIHGGFGSGSSFGITAKGLFFSVSSLVRSFFQAHGYMINMVENNVLYVIPGLVSMVFLVYSFFFIPSFIKVNNHIFRTLTVILVLNILFAVFSYGNAEFMVMIPVLVFLSSLGIFHNPEKMLFSLFCSMLTWNISYGIVPLGIKAPGAERFLVEKAVSERNSVIIASDDRLLNGMVYYYTGIDDADNIKRSPAWLKARDIDDSVLVNAIDSVLVAGGAVYTDCIASAALSRASISQGKINEEFFSRYNTTTVFSKTLITGTKSVVRITGSKFR